MVAAGSSRLPALSGVSSLGLHAPAQRVHQIDDLGRLAPARRLDLFAGLLEQFLQSVFVLIPKFLRIEMARWPAPGLDDT
jgi:hypothetical protein